MRFFPAALSAILLSGCGSDRVQVDAEALDRLSAYGCPIASGIYERAEIANLISSPTRFDGKAVQTSGYYYSASEYSAVFPDQQDPDDPYASDFSKGLWALGVDEALHGQPVTLRGVYHAKGHGHLGQWPGTICVYSTVPGDES